MRLVRISLLMFSLTVFASCQKSNDDDDSGTPSHSDLDLTGFKNTADKQDLQAKGKEATGIYGDLDAIRTSFLASGSGNGFRFRLMGATDSTESCKKTGETTEVLEGETVPVTVEACTDMRGDMPLSCEKKTYHTSNGITVKKSCSRTTSTSSTQTNSMASINVQQDFGDIANCDQAFKSFENLYSESKEQLANMLKLLDGPSDAKSLGGMQLEQQEVDDQSAIAYKFDQRDLNAGFNVSGRVSGGADATRLVLHQKISTNQSPGANASQGLPKITTETSMDQGSVAWLDKKIIEHTLDMVSDTKGEQSHSQTVKGKVQVSAGDEKFVKFAMDFTSTPPEGETTTSQNKLEAHLVDANTLTYNGSVTSGGKTGTFAFTVTRVSDQCTVAHVVNSVPH